MVRCFAKLHSLPVLATVWPVDEFMTDRSVPLSEEPSDTSSTLLWLAATRDPVAWRRLVREYGPRVYRFCRRQGLQPDCANDVVQEVFFAVSRHLSRFRHDRPGDSFRSWLLAITWNKLRDRGRQVVRWPKAEGGSDAQAAWQALAASTSASTGLDQQPTEQLLAVRQVIDRVRQEYTDEKWAMFSAVFFDDCPAEEVARLHNTTINVVYLTKSRILRRLREVLTAKSDNGD